MRDLKKKKAEPKCSEKVESNFVGLNSNRASQALISAEFSKRICAPLAKDISHHILAQ